MTPLSLIFFSVPVNYSAETAALASAALVISTDKSNLRINNSFFGKRYNDMYCWCGCIVKNKTQLLINESEFVLNRDIPLTLSDKDMQVAM